MIPITNLIILWANVPTESFAAIGYLGSLICQGSLSLADTTGLGDSASATCHGRALGGRVSAYSCARLGNMDKVDFRFNQPHKALRH